LETGIELMLRDAPADGVADSAGDAEVSDDRAGELTGADFELPEIACSAGMEGGAAATSDGRPLAAALLAADAVSSGAGPLAGDAVSCGAGG
jgi:hypothetical protein